jgi:hypothetical protein
MAKLDVELVREVQEIDCQSGPGKWNRELDILMETNACREEE